MSSRVVIIIVLTILIVLSAAILANSMTKYVGRDEQMYCTGAVCLAQGKLIYRDFSYAAQMPYHPLLCAALYKMFATTHYLLVGRFPGDDTHHRDLPAYFQAFYYNRHVTGSGGGRFVSLQSAGRLRQRLRLEP
jgi:hypothetical protein